jgi:hypothetical protein
MGNYLHCCFGSVHIKVCLDWIHSMCILYLACGQSSRPLFCNCCIGKHFYYYFFVGHYKGIQLCAFLQTLLKTTIFKDDLPALIQPSEFKSGIQYAYWSIYEAIPYYRLAFFYLEQTLLLFVSVLMLLGIWTKTSVLFGPYIWFSVSFN